MLWCKGAASLTRCVHIAEEPPPHPLPGWRRHRTGAAMRDFSLIGACQPLYKSVIGP